MPFDEYDCVLGGMTILPRNKIVLCDQENRSVKLLNLKTMRIMSSVKLSSSPRDVCAMPNDRAAVMLPVEGKIMLLIIRNKIKMKKSISIQIGSTGLCYFDETFIVTYGFGHSSKVEIVDMNGDILKTTENRSQLMQIVDPVSVAVDCREPCLYILGTRHSTVTKMDLDLNVVKTITLHYKCTHYKLKIPRSIVHLGDSHLLMCGWESNNLVLLNTVTYEMRTLLDQKIHHPWCACYNSELKRLYIYCSQVAGSNTLHVFEASSTEPVVLPH